MINRPTDFPATNGTRNKRDQPQSGSAELRRLLHELTNDLTVMSFSCFKVRDAAKPITDCAISREIERLEKMIVDMASLLESISRKLKAMPRRPPLLPTAKSAKPGEPRNVYPLFKRDPRQR